MKKLLSLLTLLLCVCSGAWADTETLSGADATSAKDNEIAKTSFTMLSTYNPSGNRTINSKNTLKVRFNQTNSATGNASGFALKVNEGYTITGLTMQVSGNGKVGTLDKIDIDGNDYTGSFATELAQNDNYTTITLSGISATDYINFVKNASSEATQLFVYITVTYEAPQFDEPQSTTISPTSAYVAVGNTTSLTGSFTGGTFEGEWLSSDETIATVSSAGVVTGVSEGTATITYQWKDDQSKEAYKATAAVTVVEAFDKNGLATVKTYDFANRGETTLAISSTAEGKIYNAANNVNNDVFRCTNEGLTSIAIQAVLSNNKGWTINSNGLYEGSGAGRCAAVCDVKAGQYIEFNHNSTTEFYTKNNNEDAGVKKAPVVEESNHHVFLVLEDGMVGFELVRGHYVTSINIYEKKSGTPTSLTFSAETAEATLGEEFTEPTLTKDPAGLTGVVFSSTNTAVATVDAETGEVTPLAAGKTNIKATFTATDEYWGAEASYELTVIDPNATGFTNEAANVEWEFQDGTTLTPETLTPDGAFLSTTVSYGNMTLDKNSAVTFKDDTDNTAYTFNTINNNTGSSVSNINIDFVVTPIPGVTFKPTNVYFEAARIGHNNGKVTITAIYGDNSSKTLKAEHEVARNNTNGFSIYTTEDIDISDGVASENPFTLRITLNKLDNGKADAFRNVKIKGVVNGTPSAITTYTITAEANDATLGTVSGGATYIEGDQVTLTATPNTGAIFEKWQKDGEDIEGNATITFNASADATYTAIFQKLFAVSFAAGEGADKGTTPNALNTVYVESTYTTPAANYYISKPGFTATGWTDGTNDYGFGEVINVVNDIVLQPIFEANTASFGEIYTKDIVVNYNFDPTKGAPLLNIENVTGYYVQQATINGKKIDMPMYINNVKGSAIEGKTGKTNNTSSNATTAQINEGSKFTIAAIPGMKVTLNASNNISTTTVGGAEPTTGSGSTTATYIYAGEAGTTDIVFGNDGRYYSSIVVTYPRTAIEKTISEAGYATHCSSFALDFSNVEGLTAYIATMNGSTVNFTAKDNLPAGVGMLLKGAQGTYTIPVIANSSNDDATTGNKFVGTTTEIENVPAGIYVLMNINDVVGFYKTTSAFTVGANTAYLPADVMAEARAFISLDGEEATGIAEVKGIAAEQQVYDLQGRRVAQPVKGLYIVNGRKVVVK